MLRMYLYRNFIHTLSEYKEQYHNQMNFKQIFPDRGYRTVTFLPQEMSRVRWKVEKGYRNLYLNAFVYIASGM